jgi:hypothetical protein
MAILTNFPLDYNDQINVIEIFDGLMRQSDHSPQAPMDRSISSPPDLPDLGLQRGPSGLQWPKPLRRAED